MASCLGIPTDTVRNVRRQQASAVDPRLEEIAGECRAIRLERAASDDWPEEEEPNAWVPPVVHVHPVELR